VRDIRSIEEGLPARFLGNNNLFRQEGWNTMPTHKASKVRAKYLAEAKCMQC
jgi:hypothetical protein